MFNFYSIDQTVPDSAGNNLLHNPIKLTELKTWITSKTFPEQRIRDEYDVSFYRTYNINSNIYSIRNYLQNFLIQKLSPIVQKIK